MTKPWFFLLPPTTSWRNFDIHSRRECHILSVTWGRFCFRWDWPNRESM